MDDGGCEKTEKQYIYTYQMDLNLLETSKWLVEQ